MTTATAQPLDGVLLTDLLEDAELAGTDVNALAGVIGDLVAHAQAGSLSDPIRRELVGQGMDAIAALWAFLLEQQPAPAEGER